MKKAAIAFMMGGAIMVKAVFAVPPEEEQSRFKKFVFEEQKIEGKIRRPQLVMIKADQRPDFEPMVLQTIGKTADIAGSVEKSILEKSPYDGAFSFRNKRIINYIP